MMGESGIDDMWKKGSLSILQLYVLKSFGEGPKSGYDLLREIKEKTEGHWVPSKGALYPLIKKLEKQGLLHVIERGARGVKKYILTPEGRQELEALPEQTRQVFQKTRWMGRLMDNIYAGMDEEAFDIILKLRYSIMLGLMDENVPNNEVKKIMREAIQELKAMGVRYGQEEEESN